MESSLGPESRPASLEELQRSFRSLRTLFHALLVILLILSGSFCVYLLREVSFSRRQVRELSQFVTNYESSSLPMMRTFLAGLYEFSKANPDFAPILSKYFTPTNEMPTASTGTLDSGDRQPARMPPSIPTK